MFNLIILIGHDKYISLLPYYRYYTVNHAASCCAVNIPKSCNSTLGPPSGSGQGTPVIAPTWAPSSITAIAVPVIAPVTTVATVAPVTTVATVAASTAAVAPRAGPTARGAAPHVLLEGAWGSTKFIQIPSHNKCHHTCNWYDPRISL